MRNLDIGRPRGPAEAVRRERIQAAVSEREFERIADAAERAGKTLSTWARERLLLAAAD